MKPQLIEFNNGQYGVLVERSSQPHKSKFVSLDQPAVTCCKPERVREFCMGTKEQAQHALDVVLHADIDLSFEVVR